MVCYCSYESIHKHVTLNTRFVANRKSDEKRQALSRGKFRRHGFAFPDLNVDINHFPLRPLISCFGFVDNEFALNFDSIHFVFIVYNSTYALLAVRGVGGIFKSFSHLSTLEQSLTEES